MSCCTPTYCLSYTCFVVLHTCVLLVYALFTRLDKTDIVRIFVRICNVNVDKKCVCVLDTNSIRLK